MNAPPEDATCDVCSSPFKPGQWWTYHYRLSVYVHGYCAARHLVRREDISMHTVLTGRIPEEEA